MAHLFDQPNNITTIKWQDDPDFRGSFSIISTCTITLALGVWSAVHLNLPTSPGNWVEAFLRRSAWVLCSLFAPEALVLVAWSQLTAAKKVQKMVEESLVHKTDTAPANTEAQRPSLKNKWTMTHSFWVVMGGIAVDVNGSEPFLTIDHPPKLTINGLWLLLKKEPQLVPDIPEDELKDKSKGDWFTKSLACIQSTWFCASCFVRVGQSLPLSLFELNTFAHAICTIVVYFIWWKKPLDVERPLLIQSEQIRPLLAFMWMSSKASARPPIKSKNSDYTYAVGQDPEFEAITLGKKLPPPNDEMTTTPEGKPPSTVIASVTSSQGLRGTEFYVNDSSTRWDVKETYSAPSSGEFDRYGVDASYTRKYKEPAVFKLTESDARRWRLAQEAIDKYKLRKPTKDLDFITKKQIPELIDLPDTGTGGQIRAKDMWAMMGFSTLAACYGAFHALGWNTRFPTRRERILWRVSSLLIVCPAGIFFTVVLFLATNAFIKHVLDRIRKRFKQHNDGGAVDSSANAKTQENGKDAGKPGVSCETASQGSPNAESGGHAKAAKATTAKQPSSESDDVWNVFGPLLMLVLMATYIPARAYIVIESFRMVFYLPPDAFKATQWEKYFPHIG